MEYKTRKELGDVAALHESISATAGMSHSQRLERWAQLLERRTDQRLATLYETEYALATDRAHLRSDGSPISIAFSDPVLRAAGMTSDTYGEAKRFFELSDRQLHRALCYCHFGSTVAAITVAHQIRGVVQSEKLWARISAFFCG
jgi:hypothetical protein